MFAAVVLAAALASPTPAPQYPVQTPPPEPNHITIDLTQQWLKTASNGWQNTTGVSTQASLRYEFQTSQHTRFNNTFHWEHMTSTWDGTFGNQTFTIPYDYTLYDDELSLELGHPEYPFGVGLGYFSYSPIFDGQTRYTMQSWGLGIDQWTNYYRPSSYYYSAWYYPSLSSSTPNEGTYGVLRADLGVNLRPNLVSPWNVKLGVQSESWFAHGAPASDLWIVGPYVSLSYWR